jgi:hypothetical protein
VKPRIRSAGKSGSTGPTFGRAGRRWSLPPGADCDADAWGRNKGYRSGLKVYCATLNRQQIADLLREFKNPDQMFRALIVKGSPFVSLSISPTKAADD